MLRAMRLPYSDATIIEVRKKMNDEEELQPHFFDPNSRLHSVAPLSSNLSIPPELSLIWGNVICKCNTQ
jgi:hypothetical protein